MFFDRIFLLLKDLLNILKAGRAKIVTNSRNTFPGNSHLSFHSSYKLFINVLSSHVTYSSSDNAFSYIRCQSTITIISSPPPECYKMNALQYYREKPLQSDDMTNSKAFCSKLWLYNFNSVFCLVFLRVEYRKNTVTEADSDSLYCGQVP